MKERRLKRMPIAQRNDLEHDADMGVIQRQAQQQFNKRGKQWDTSQTNR